MPVGRSHIAAIAGALLGLVLAASSRALEAPIEALPGAAPFSDALREQLAQELARLIPQLSGRDARRGRTTAYVCENRVCKYPTTDPDTFAAQLGGSNAASPPQP